MEPAETRAGRALGASSQWTRRGAVVGADYSVGGKLDQARVTAQMAAHEHRRGEQAEVVAFDGFDVLGVQTQVPRHILDGKSQRFARGSQTFTGTSGVFRVARVRLARKTCHV